MFSSSQCYNSVVMWLSLRNAQPMLSMVVPLVKCSASGGKGDKALSLCEGAFVALAKSYSFELIMSD